MNDISADLALSILRVTVGLFVAAHGAQKLFGWFDGPGPERWAGAVGGMGFSPARPISLLASFTEFFGGLAVALGLITPLACGALVVDMAVAIAKVHAPKGFFVTAGGYEYALVLLIAFAVLGLMDGAPLFLATFVVGAIVTTVALLTGARAGTRRAV